MRIYMQIGISMYLYVHKCLSDRVLFGYLLGGEIRYAVLFFLIWVCFFLFMRLKMWSLKEFRCVFALICVEFVIRVQPMFMWWFYAYIWGVWFWWEGNEFSPVFDWSCFGVSIVPEWFYLLSLWFLHFGFIQLFTTICSPEVWRFPHSLNFRIYICLFHFYFFFMSIILGSSFGIQFYLDSLGRVINWIWYVHTFEFETLISFQCVLFLFVSSPLGILLLSPRICSFVDLEVKITM